MDTFLSISLTLIVISISLYVISFWFTPKKIGALIPPGKQGLPIVGETLEFIRSTQKGSPEKFILDRMNKYSPTVFKTSLMGEKVIVFCGAIGNKCLFQSDNKFVTAWWPRSITKLIISPENSHRDMTKIKKEVRNIASAFLKPEILQKKFVGVMDYISKQHIENKWAPHEQVHAFDLANDYTFSLACRLFLSIEDPKSVSRLEGLFKDITTGMLTIPINFPGTTYYRAIKSARAFHAEVLATIKQRKRDLALDKMSDSAASKDMLSNMLLSSYEDGEFPDDMLNVVADMVLGFLIAGHDTASIAVTFIIKFLAELPHVYDEVLKEQLEIANNKIPGELLNWEDILKMKYTWNVAYEAMRLAPPAQGAFREATTDFTCDGFTIPKGWKAYWTVHSTNKNPEYFENPEKFDPTRFQGNGPAPYSFVPFGGGPHICPGREYARIEILVFIHNLVTQFELKKILPNEKTLYGVGAIPANGLPIRLHPRNGKTNQSHFS